MNIIKMKRIVLVRLKSVKPIVTKKKSEEKTTMGLKVSKQATNKKRLWWSVSPILYIFCFSIFGHCLFKDSYHLLSLWRHSKILFLSVFFSSVRSDIIFLWKYIFTWQWWKKIVMWLSSLWRHADSTMISFVLSKFSFCNCCIIGIGTLHLTNNHLLQNGDVRVTVHGIEFSFDLIVEEQFCFFKRKME